MADDRSDDGEGHAVHRCCGRQAKGEGEEREGGYDMWDQLPRVIFTTAGWSNVNGF